MSRFRAELWIAQWEDLGGEAWSTTPAMSFVQPRAAWLGLSYPGAVDARIEALAEEIDSDPAKRLAVLSVLHSRESRRTPIRLTAD